MSGAGAMTEEQIYTVSEVAEILRLSTKTVYKMLRDGEIEYFTVRDEYRVTRAALDAYKAQQTGRRRKREGE